jgi:chromosome segregation ATPase
VTTNRILPIANLIGCLLITGIIVVQWINERITHNAMGTLNQELAATREQLNSEKTRAIALENDVKQLKESIASTMLARKETEEAMAKMTAERNAQTASIESAVATNNEAILKQTDIWEKALAERDAKIRELSASLGAARSRLDSAIAELKAAGAR